MLALQRLANEVGKVYSKMTPEDKKRIHAIFDTIEQLETIKEILPWENVIHGIISKYKRRDK